MLTVKEVSYKNFGKCLLIANDSFEVYVTVDVGPRIIKCNIKGKENLFFEDTERNMREDVSAVYGDGRVWNIYGGHRLWLSPESYPETYYPDNEKVIYSTSVSGITFTPPRQQITGLQHRLTLAPDPSLPKMKIVHQIENCSDAPVTGAAWALTVMDKCGTALYPQNDCDTGLLGNRVLALWPYTEMTDSRVFWGDKYIALRQNPEIDKKFKFGFSSDKGMLAYFNHGQALVKRFPPFKHDSQYPDFGVSCEAFANKYFTEAESLSELRTIRPGEYIEHVENWTVVDGVEPPEFTNESCEKAARVFED